MIIQGRDVLKTAVEILAGNGPVYLAVSYWSGGATKALGLSEAHRDRVRVVLDVSGGGTCPNELQDLVHAIGCKNVRVHPDLHAKVYASRDLALVGSANATRPGLQIEITERVEICTRLSGEHARGAFDSARALFEDGASEPFCDAHVEICQRLFGNRTLASSQAGFSGEIDVFEALIMQHEALSALPLLITSEEGSDEGREEAWDERRPEDAPVTFNKKDWDDFCPPFAEEYDNNPCIGLHAPGKKILSASYLRPRFRKGNWGFAERLEWNGLPDEVKKPKGKKPIKMKPSVKRDTLRKAIQKLEGDGNVFRRVSDLYRILRDMDG